MAKLQQCEWQLFDVHRLGPGNKPKYLDSELQLIEDVNGSRQLLASAQLNLEERRYFANEGRVMFMDVPNQPSQFVEVTGG